MRLSEKGKIRLLIGLASVSTLMLSQVANADLLVIGSKQSGVRSLSQSQIAAIYMGKPTNLNQQFTPYDQPNYSQVYRDFCQNVLGKSPDQMSQYWADQTFKGLGSAPAQLSSLDELFSLIANYPGVIGYVDSNQIPASYLQSVRIYYGGHPVDQGVKKSDAEKSLVKPVKQVEQPKSVVIPREQALGLWGEVLASNNLDRLYENAGVQEEIKRFMVDGDLQQRINNATPFIHYVYAQAEKMGIPAQFALLPLMESNYNPQAVNRNGAGLWQLERATAKDMGLRVDSGYDCRKDIVTSTHAALQHLLDGFNRFHDWQLTAAAYNCGTGPVESAIKRNLSEGKATDFWGIRSQLPHITQAYVPRLIALSYMLNRASHYNIYLPNLSTKASLQVVEIKQPLTIEQLSQLSGVSVEQLKHLNPGILEDKTPRKYLCHLLLPVSVVTDFNSHLNSMNQLQARKLTEKNAAAAKLWAEKQAAAKLAKQKAIALQKQREADALVAKQSQQAALAADKASKEEELSPYAVSGVGKKVDPDQNLKSLLSKIYN